jgi:nucleotide-binding universal stress UspA family protein
MKILVPFDFTKVSHSAFKYSLHLANHMNAEIHLMYVLNGAFSTSDSMFLDTIEDVYDHAKSQMEAYIDSESENNPLADTIFVHSVVRFGVPGFTLADYANDNHFDYVVSGMRDQHNVIERFLGTTSTILTKLASCPVILIHENTPWILPKKTIFTIDDTADFDESIQKYLEFNANFSAATDFIHVRKDQKDDALFSKDAVIKELFQKKYPDFTFDIKTIYGGDIVQSIVDYSIFEKADMLVMVHRKRSLLDTFFNRSLSLKTAEGIHLPVMVLEENVVNDKHQTKAT